jgi:ATP-binding cassette subfamily B protein
MNFLSLLRYVTPPGWTLLFTASLLLASSATALVQPWLAGQLTSTLIGEGGALWSANTILSIWLGVLILRSLLDFACQYKIGSTAETMNVKLRARLFEHLQKIPLAHFHQHRTGDSLALFSNDADIISGFVTTTLVQLLPLIITCLGAFAMIALIDPMVAGIAALLLPVYYLTTKLLGRRLRPLSREWIDAYRDFISHLEESLRMIPAIKAFVREPLERMRFGQHIHRVSELARRQVFIGALLSPSIALLAGLGLLLVLWLGSARVADGGMAVAELVSLLLYAMLLVQPLRGLANLYGEVQQARGATERILEFLNTAAEENGENLPTLPPVLGQIVFDNITYAYPGGKTVLHDFQLYIQRGETLAVTGVNGTGKSTLIHLLLRLAAPQQGRITIDGHDIAGYRLATVRQQIGVVAQQTLLLGGTVKENIAYGIPGANDADIERAAQRACAHDFICQLPQGYDSLIGEQGLRLSGGQRQRISLARTLLIDPPILVLDEATSMFDPLGEEDFVRNCQQQFADKTVILITHQPACLALADRIITLSPGGAFTTEKIAARGPLQLHENETLDQRRG